MLITIPGFAALYEKQKEQLQAMPMDNFRVFIIMELVRDRYAVFYTNAFLFDEAIARKLQGDP